MGRTQKSKLQAAAMKIQTRTRSQQAKGLTASLRSERILSRSAYKSYLNAFTLDNTLPVNGWAGLQLLNYSLPNLKLLFTKYKLLSGWLRLAALKFTCAGS